jgi:YHS domain-containing protein
MDGKAKLLGYFVTLLVVALGAFVLLAGCPKDKPTVGTKATQTKAGAAAPAPMNHEAMSTSVKQEATAAPATQAAQTAEQTTCPVMGGAINKDIFVEYQGKKVYFCCKECLDVFKANPEKYISKLPQFTK